MDDEGSGKGRKGKKRKRGDNKKKVWKGDWSREEQERFIQSVVSFPPGRWGDVKKFGKLEGKSEEEVKKYGGDWALACASAAEVCVYFILFYFILFYFILFYFILFYFILFYFILFYFILYYFIFYFILFYFIFYFIFNFIFNF